MNTEIVTKEQVIESKDQETLATYLVQNNSFEYNMDKAIEEAIEFAEVLVKLKTKHKDNPKRPKLEEALKEFGDVILRGSVAVMQLYKDEETDPAEFVEQHIQTKCNKLIGYLEKGTYKGGL